MHAVVESWHVHHLCETTLEGILRTVHTLCDRTCGVEPVADVLQVAGYLAPFLAPLLRNLVAYRPHHDGGVITVSQHEVRHIPVAPLLEETGIAVLALRIDPHVEALRHHHHTQ